MKVQEIASLWEAFAPLAFAEPWDKVGLQVGDPEAEVTGILLTLDVTVDAIQAARKAKTSLILAHHPVLFTPAERILSTTHQGKVLIAAIQNGIHIYISHTNLDSAPGGLNDFLAQRLSLKNVTPLKPLPDHLRAGLGRVGLLPKPVTLETLITQVKTGWETKQVRWVGDLKKKVQKVALCSGSGGSLLGDVFCHDCDVYITGDLKYAQSLEARSMGLNVIDVPHQDSEIHCVEIFERELTLRFKRHRNAPTLTRFALEADLLSFHYADRFNTAVAHPD